MAIDRSVSLPPYIFYEVLTPVRFRATESIRVLKDDQTRTFSELPILTELYPGHRLWMEVEEWEKTQGSISYTCDGAPFFTVYLQAKWKVLWPGELNDILAPTMWSPEGASRETLLQRIKDTREAVRKADESAKTKVLLIKGLLAYSDFAQCCGPWANEKDWKQYHKGLE